MNATSGTSQGFRLKGNSLKMLLGYAFAAICLIWVFHDLHPRRALEQIKIAHWAFVVPAVLFDISTYVLQGWRWSLLLRPNGRISSVRTTQAIYAALFTNEMLPLRVGEGVRAFLVAKWLNAPVRKMFSSILVERLFDAVCLLVGVGYTAIVAPLPQNLAVAGDVLGVLVLAATVTFLVIVFRHQDTQSHDSSPKGGFVRHVASDVREIGLSRSLYLPVALSAGMLVSQAMATWFMMLSFGLDLPVGAAFVVLFIVRLGTAIPNAPANIGSFQFFTIVALAIYGVPKATATAFSIVDFLALTVPLWTLGLAALFSCGMSLSALRNLRFGDGSSEIEKRAPGATRLCS